MEDTEHLSINQLDASAAAGGLKLSTEARWNQNEADWRFFLSKGVVFGVRDDAGRLVATAALLPYTAGRLVARVHDVGEVLSTEHTEDGTRLHARVGPALAAELNAAAVS